MNRVGLTCYVACAGLLAVLLGALTSQPIAFALSGSSDSIRSPQVAQESGSEEAEEEIVLDCKYPKLSSYAGMHFAFDIELTYKGGEEPRLFDLAVDVPQGFKYSIAKGYGQQGTEIAAIRLDPGKSYGESIKVTVRPYAWLSPEPGEYPVAVMVSSDGLQNSIDLTAIVTAKYDLELATSTGRLNAEATAGEDNYLSIQITNTGSAKLENLVFDSKVTGRPSGWSVTFSPEEIDSLAVGTTREIEVNMKPPPKTISGDYMINLSAEPESKNAFGSVDVRVTVLTPTIWGWVGVGIVVLVIAGLAVMFVRLGRR